jgi:hypothetical protein
MYIFNIPMADPLYSKIYRKTTKKERVSGDEGD